MTSLSSIECMMYIHYSVIEYISFRVVTSIISQSEMSRCVLTDTAAKQIEAVWKQYFKDASILPVIGYPSYKKAGVMTLTHSMGGPLMTIDGLESKSPLSNNALYSVECVDGVYLNLYEIMLPEIPGVSGSLSTSETYKKELFKRGIVVQGDHYHWNGATILEADKGVTAIHSKAVGMNPIQFAHANGQALSAVMDILEQYM